MKKCPKCFVVKGADGFYKNKSTKSGLSYWCADCNKEYSNNRYKTEEHKEYLASIQNELIKYRKEYRGKNLEALTKKDRQKYLNNKADYIARAAKRRAYKLKATPDWANAESIKSIYAMSKLLDELNPFVKHHVDHIVPLNNKFVCGLHVEHNLQILSAKENLSKSSKFNPNIGA